jgi:hypothetical protein
VGIKGVIFGIHVSFFMKPEYIIEAYKKSRSQQERDRLAHEFIRIIIRNPVNKQWKFILNKIQGEKWVPITWPINCKGVYEISNFGRLKSMETHRKHKRYGKVKYKERISEWRLGRKHYPHTQLSVNGKTYKAVIHILVAKHFVKNVHNKPWVNHKDGDRSNNHYKNLEWNTTKENNQHARKTGLNISVAENHSLAKITNKNAIDIFNSSESAKILSQKYKIHISTIRKIKIGKSWSTITGKKYKKAKRLTPRKVIAIFKSRKSTKDLSRMYNTCVANVNLVRNGKAWSHITREL